ncbi:MAG: TIGR01777 family protein [Desulfobacteraceae bacterium]|nr:TIGR01777 family protein [Desulfobacteraceae bacterium]
MKTILIPGASGFIGLNAAKFFLLKGFQVIGMGTSRSHPFTQQYDGFQWITADTSKEGPWQAHVQKADIVINVAGRTIFKRWTKSYKQVIYDSRIKTTRHIVSAIQPARPQVLLNTSAVGLYGDCGDEVLLEDHKPGQGFLSCLCEDWESEALHASDKGVRVVRMRFGVVLGHGGALSTMTPVFKMGIGGSLGSGRQWFPWIHMEDLLAAMAFLIETPNAKGPYNFTAPGTIKQKDFAGYLGKLLGRPSFVPTPGFAVKIMMGEVADALMESQRAIPQRLLDAGFQFSYPDVLPALKNLFPN